MLTIKKDVVLLFAVAYLSMFARVFWSGNILHPLWKYREVFYVQTVKDISPPEVGRFLFIRFKNPKLHNDFH